MGFQETDLREQKTKNPIYVHVYKIVINKQSHRDNEGREESALYLDPKSKAQYFLPQWMVIN